MTSPDLPPIQRIDVAQVIHALERSIRSLDHQANQLAALGDYAAEHPAEDAQRLREAIALLNNSHRAPAYVRADLALAAMPANWADDPDTAALARALGLDAPATADDVAADTWRLHPEYAPGGGLWAPPTAAADAAVHAPPAAATGQQPHRPAQPLIARLACWWYGCQPDYDRPSAIAPDYIVPCKRCGAPDTSYADRVGDTRHHRTRAALRYWLYRRWWPAPCSECGGRWRHRDGCDGFPF